MRHGEAWFSLPASFLNFPMDDSRKPSSTPDTKLSGGGSGRIDGLDEIRLGGGCLRLVPNPLAPKKIDAWVIGAACAEVELLTATFHYSASTFSPSSGPRPHGPYRSTSSPSLPCDSICLTTRAHRPRVMPPRTACDSCASAFYRLRCHPRT